MEIITDSQLLRAVEDFLTATDTKPTRFGREVMGDGSLVTHLRKGRSLSLKNAKRVIEHIVEHQPKPARKPTRKSQTVTQ